MRASVSLRQFFHLLYPESLEVFYETDHNLALTGPHDACDIERSPSQRSRSTSNSHRNLVNSTATKSLKGFLPKLTVLPKH